MSDIDRFLPGVERRGLRRLRLRREGRSEQRRDAPEVEAARDT